MRFLANENISDGLVKLLRNSGHDVLWVKEFMRGEKDTKILAFAQAEQRILVTYDKDFGELAFRVGLPAECGVLLLRLAGSDPDSEIRQAFRVIDGRADWAGYFSVVSEDRIRMRRLSSASNNPDND